VPEEPETPAGQPDIDPGYSTSGVPTFDSVREKIESRYETSIGSAELDAETPEGRDVEDQYEARQRAGRRSVSPNPRINARRQRRLSAGLGRRHPVDVDVLRQTLEPVWPKAFEE
jgi:hypothetical protein